MEFSRFLATPHEAIAIFSLQAKPARNRVFLYFIKSLGRIAAPPVSTIGWRTNQKFHPGATDIIAIAALHGPRHDPRAPKMRRWTPRNPTEVYLEP